MRKGKRAKVSEKQKTELKIFNSALFFEEFSKYP